MDAMRDDRFSKTDLSVGQEPTSQDTLLFEEGLELLARYRTIGDPQIRLLIRQLITGAADGCAGEQ